MTRELSQDEPWQQDLVPPTRVPDVLPVIHATGAKITWTGSAITSFSMPSIFGQQTKLIITQQLEESARKLCEQMNQAFNDFFLVYQAIPAELKQPKPKNKKYPHDPSTSKLYPTSFDSWGCEYVQPTRGPQSFKRKTKQRRRR